MLTDALCITGKHVAKSRWPSKDKRLKKLWCTPTMRYLLFSCWITSNSCNPMDCSTLGFPVLHYLPEFAQMSIESVMPTNHLCLCHSLPPALSLSQPQNIFRWVNSVSSGQIISASAAASVLPMTIQGRCPLGLTGLISLLAKGLPRVFSNTTVLNHQFFGIQPSLWSSSHIHTWPLEKP